MFQEKVKKEGLNIKPKPVKPRKSYSLIVPTLTEF